MQSSIGMEQADSPLERLPDEVLVDSLLPLLDNRDLLAVSEVNQHLSNVASDGTFWKRKLKQDFNYDANLNNRAQGWKEFYSKLRRLAVYCWGSAGNSRLGIPRNHPSYSSLNTVNGVSKPVRLPIPDTVGLIELFANGWGFIGLDTVGRIHVWGVLDGEVLAWRAGRDWTDPGKPCDQPRMVLLKEAGGGKIVSLSCGRKHFLTVDEHDSIFEFMSWGLAKRIDSAAFSSMSFKIQQVECGWNHSCLLSTQSEIFVWYPFQPHENTHRSPPPQNTPLINAPGELEIPVKLVPSREEMPIKLPEIRMEGEDISQRRRVVKIACGDGFVIALTADGEVWAARVGGDESEIGVQDDLGHTKVWSFLEKFSTLSDPSSRITHVSAAFQTFFAYSSSTVLKGTKDKLFNFSSEPEPEIIPELQNRGVMKVVLGDYHFGALTSDGKLLTWGAYSSGALGLGASREKVVAPKEVDFGEGAYVFNAAACGWHTGALVTGGPSLEDQQKAVDAENSAYFSALRRNNRNMPQATNIPMGTNIYNNVSSASTSASASVAQSDLHSAPLSSSVNPQSPPSVPVDAPSSFPSVRHVFHAPNIGTRLLPTSTLTETDDLAPMPTTDAPAGDPRIPGESATDSAALEDTPQFNSAETENDSMGIVTPGVGGARAIGITGNHHDGPTMPRYRIGLAGAGAFRGSGRGAGRGGIRQHGGGEESEGGGRGTDTAAQ